jgi:hypothetical protein
LTDQKEKMNKIKNMLCNPVVAENLMHQNFMNLLKYHSKDGVIETLESWFLDFVDRDNKFVIEFQTTFNSSFWELYINQVLIKLGHKANFSYSAPDFVVEGKFCIECTIASNADGETPEHDMDSKIPRSPYILRDPIVDKATIRLANSFISKFKKYNATYSKLRHVNTLPFIIAIAPFDQPLTQAQRDQAITRVLYGYDKPIWEPIDSLNYKLVKHQYMDSIDKPNGSEIPLGFFLSDECSDISCVIFSPLATISKVIALCDAKNNAIWEVDYYNRIGYETNHKILKGEDYSEDLIEGIHIFLNPFAKRKFPLDYFNSNRIVWHDYDFDSKHPVYKCPDEAIFNRQPISIHIKK